MPARRLTFTIALCCALAALMATAFAASGHTVLRGTRDASICTKSAVNTSPRVHFLATKLGARVLRFDVDWDDLEDERGVYDQVYFDRLATTIHAAASEGMQVIVTIFGTPRWASDRSLWGMVPPGYKSGYYHFFYPPSLDHLDDLQAFATHMATAFAGDATGYECRNEPNLWGSLYPQRTASDAAFGVRRYAAMLTAFSKGIRAGDPHALVIAGATSPIGDNSAMRTSPQRFARLLKKLVPSSVFDAYSHHPYTIGGSRNKAPEAMPNDPTRAVSLGNISTLLKIFPDKPFYLTEYGYYTQYSALFGIYVNQPTQASYLTRAYRYCARFPQVKALIWFPYHDSRNKVWGTYSGLVTDGGSYKRSWYAFARGNSLTLNARRSDDVVRLSGRLSSLAMGGLAGKKLVVYGRLPGRSWWAVQTITTRTGGAYRLSLTVPERASYRVAWSGVVRSRVLTVAGE